MKKATKDEDTNSREKSKEESGNATDLLLQRIEIEPNALQ
jgi:hypothetical protein